MQRKRKFAQARGLVRIEGIALAGEVTEREDKKDREHSAPNNPPMFMNDLLCSLAL